MSRGRVSVEFIQKEKSRKISLQMRKIDLMTKVEELSILCDVDACVILYAPNFEGQGYAEPKTWPKDTKEVQRILQRYYNTTIDRRLKTYNIQKYFKERMKKVEFEISKVRKEKLKMKYQPSPMVSTAQSSQPSLMVSCAQSFYHVESKAGRYVQSYPCKQIDVDWTHHVDANVTYHHPKIDMKQKDDARNDKILPPYYYNGNGMIMQSYPIDIYAYSSFSESFKLIPWTST